MKIIRKTAVVFLCLLLLLGICGCNIIASFLGKKAIEEAEAIPKIAFGTMTVSEDSDETVMSVEELLDKEIKYDEYRSDFHYSCLTEDERLLYNSFEYALENGFTFIYVDDLIVRSADSFGQVLNFLALDSPFLEQNLIYETGTFTTYYEVDKSGYAELDGAYLYVENFSSQAWAKKLEALEKAKELVDKMPNGLNDADKARYLHRYTVENVEYYDYDGKDGVGNYLYDGLIAGKTHCDGSANMLSLLLNIAGIDCYEKMHTGENIVGHTWNMVKLDNEWYNVDATAQKKDQTDNIEHYLKGNFAFEDRLQRFIPDYSEIYPEVADGLDSLINAHIQAVDKTGFVNTVKDAFSENGENYAVLLVDSYNESDAEEAMQRLADSLKTRVSWYCYEVIGNRTIMIIYL